MIKNKRILICGGSGFIGQNAIKYFYNHNKIYCTYYKNKPKEDFKNVVWIKANLLNKNSLINLFKKYKYDYVIQSAAVTAGVKSMQSDPFMFISDNAIMNSLLIKQAVLHKIKHFIFLSCTVMYHSSEKKLSEKDLDLKKKIHPNYEGIAYTKLYIENICKFYSNNSNTKFTALRHSNIYGPYDKFNNPNGHFMSSMISKLYNSNSSALEIWGDGSEKRDFLYIDDLLRGMDLVFKKQQSSFEVFNISYGQSFSVKQIVNKLIKISKIKKTATFLKNKPTIKVNILVDSKKIIKKINWRNENKIDEGINKTIRWYMTKYNKN